MNKDKTIKDLKKRNDKLLEQYRLRDFRCITLENRLDKLHKEIEQLTLENMRLIEEGKNLIKKINGLEKGE